MSHFGVPAPPHAARPETQRPSQVPMWVVLLAVVLMLVLAAVTGFVLLRDPDADKGPSYPRAWDSRIAPFAKIAEKKRGLIFLHPVHVRFLPAAEFEKTVTADEKELSKDDRADLDQFAGLLRALGLIRGDIDLFESVNDVRGGGTLAYYSFKDERITIRGKRLTPAVRSTLVHELTHVLQDQHFKIGDRMQKLAKLPDDQPQTSTASVLQAVVEGDASRVETLYRESLKGKKRKALDAGSRQESAQAMARIGKAPKVVVTMLSAPYTLGEGMVQTVAQDGGNTAVNELLRTTPQHESALLDPFRLLADDADGKKVEVPKLEKGEKRRDFGEFGVLTWYLMLAERLPLLDALAAADGWGGDSYVSFERDGAACARLAYRGSTPKDTTRMYDALRRWDAAAPKAPATVSRGGGLVRLESCDPGKAADVGGDKSEDAVALALTRTYFGIGLLRTGASSSMARCGSDKVVRTYPLSRLSDPTFGTGATEQAQMRQIGASCA